MGLTKNLIFIFLLSASSFNSFAQKSIGTQFTQYIEPGISISYDTVAFMPAGGYTNTHTGISSFDFKRKENVEKRIMINVKGRAAFKTPVSSAFQDSFMLASLPGLKNLEGDSIKISESDTAIRHINGCSCLGLSMSSPFNDSAAVTIICNHISTDNIVQIQYVGRSQKKLEEAYTYFKEFLAGFKSYPPIEIYQNDSILKSKYTLSIIPSKKIPFNFESRTKTYSGVATVDPKPTLSERIKEVRLHNTYGSEIFTPDEDQTVFIMSNDKQKGRIKKEGELILISSYGKEIAIPFSFYYDNQ